MHVLEDIVKTFLKEKSIVIGSTWRPLKNIDRWIKNNKKTTEGQHKLQAFDVLTQYFNTKWNNINPSLYFKAGFDLFGETFYHGKFFDRRLMKHYISLDKQKKRFNENVQKDILDSLMFIKNNYNNLKEYLSRDFDKILEDFMFNNIGKYFLAYIVTKFNLKLTDIQQLKFSEFTSNYRQYIIDIKQAKINGL